MHEKIVVTVDNVCDIPPLDLFEFLHAKVGNVLIPEILVPVDLSKMCKIIALYSTYLSFLRELYARLDIATRETKNRRQNADDMICRKTIIKAYIDNLDDCVKAASRISSLYISQAQFENRFQGKFSL